MSNVFFNLDVENLKKSAVIPLTAALVMGFSFLLDISFGSFRSLLLTLTWASAGMLFANRICQASEKPDLKNIAIHAAILAGAASLVYEIIAWLSISIENSNWAINIGSIVFYVAESSFIGVLAAAAWVAYQHEKEG